MKTKIKIQITAVLVWVLSLTGYSYAANSWSIGALFKKITGIENGVSVVDVWRLDGSAIEDWTVSGTEIKDNDITSADIKNGAIEGVDIKDGSIDTIDIKNWSIGSSDIKDNDIQSHDIKDGTVNSMDIADNTIQTQDITDGTIQSIDIKNSSITGLDIADNTISTNDILNGTIESHDIKDGTVNSNDIANNTIQSADIKDGTIVSSDISDNAVMSSDIRDGTVSWVDVANGTLSTNHFSNSASINNANKLGDKLASEYLIKNSTTRQDVNSDIQITQDLFVKDRIGVGTLNPSQKLHVEWNALVTGNAQIKGDTVINGNTHIDGNLKVVGTTVIADGQKLLFENDEDRVFANRKTNLPFQKLWSNSYLKPDIKGDFKAPVVVAHRPSYFVEEADGTVIGLRVGYDGEKRGLFYMYSKSGQKQDLHMTDQQYFLPALETAWFYPCDLISSNQFGFTFAACSYDDAAVKQYYFLGNNADSLDPSINDNQLTEITSIYKGGYKIDYIADKKIYVQYQGHGTNSRMYIYDDTFAAINFTNPINSTDNSLVFNFDPSTWQYWDFKGTTYAGGCRGGPRSAYAAYNANDGKVYFQFVNCFRERRPASLGFSYFHTLANIKLAYNPETQAIEYLNTMPIVFDPAANSANNFNGSIWNISTSTPIYYINHHTSYLKKSKRVWHTGVKAYPGQIQRQGVSIAEFTNSTQLDYVYQNGDLSTDVHPSRKVGFSSEIEKTPYDASLLWKYLEQGIFASKNRFAMKSTRFNYWKTSLESGFVSTKVQIADSDTINKEGNVEIAEVNYAKLVWANKSLDENGENIAYRIEGNNIMKYLGGSNDGKGAIINHVTLPSNWKDLIKTELNKTADQYYIDKPVAIIPDGKTNRTVNQSNIDKTIYGFRIIPVSDSHFFVNFAIADKRFSIDSAGQKYPMNYMYYQMFSYNSSWVSPMGSSILYAADQVRYTCSAGYSPDSISYLEWSNLYIIDTGLTCQTMWSGARRNTIQVQFDVAMNTAITTRYIWSIGHQYYATQIPLWLHHLFGAHFTTRGHHIQLNSYADFTVLDWKERVKKSFNDFWIANNSGRKVMSIQPPTGFIIYVSSSEITANGESGTLKTASYDLSKVLPGITDNAQLQNKTIYGYPDDTEPGLLVFSLTRDSTKQHIVEVMTHNEGIKRIDILDGLTITTNDVSISTLHIKNHIIIRDKVNGNDYMLSVSNGALKVEQYK